MTCSLSWLVSVVIVETVPKVLLFSVAATTSSFSLGFIPNIAANLPVRDVLLVCESSFIVSGVLLVISSSLPIGENSIVFVPCSSTFGIGVDSVVFRSAQFMLCSGVSMSISLIGTFDSSGNFSSVFCSLLLLVLTIFTQLFLLITLGFVDVSFRSDED